MSDLRSSDLKYPVQSHTSTLTFTSRHDNTFNEVVFKRGCRHVAADRSFETCDEGLAIMTGKKNWMFQESQRNLSRRMWHRERLVC
jgi:hypothetical protein